MKYKYPCTPDCPRRSTTCHGTCKEYAQAVAKNEKIRKARQKALFDNSYHAKAVVEAKMKNIKRKMGK